MSVRFFGVVRSWIDKFFEIEKNDRIKLVNLAITFFFIIGSYSILRSLKASIFLGFVGREYQPLAKILALAMLFPVMLLYSKVVDKVRRYQVVLIVFIFYAIGCLIFAGIFMHPVYGVRNTMTSPYRLVGWMFEFFMDFYQALIVSGFWSFVTSISTPNFANKTYGMIVAASRIGGIVSTMLGVVLLNNTFIECWVSISLIAFAGAILLLCAAFFLYRIIKKIPRDELHGYEAAYVASAQKEQSKEKTGVFEGLRLMVTEPYVMGIFGMVCSFEIINIIFDYKMEVLMSIETNNNVAAMSRYMMIYTGTFQALSFFLAFFGTTAFLRYVGIRFGIFVMPLTMLVLGFVLFSYPSLSTVFVVLVISRALNYGFNNPMREILYIPTIKDIQFKSKSWIDSFGRTISKSSGATINLLTAFQSIGLQTAFMFVFITSVSSVWLVIAYMMGRKYVKTVENNEVIGINDNGNNI
ncbi:MAG: Npt1/Npt2 family nucleotide transporter [bacterium]